MADLEVPLEGETAPKDVINNDQSTEIDKPSTEATTEETCEGKEATTTSSTGQEVEKEEEPITEPPTEQNVEDEVEENTATEQIVTTDTTTEDGGTVIEQNVTAGEGEGDVVTATAVGEGEGEVVTAGEGEGEVVTTTGEGEVVTTTGEGEGDVVTATGEGEGEGETIAANTRRSVFENHRLETYIWEPEGTPRALLCICHGVHEHMGRYEKLINHLKSKGILVFGMDLVGHGNSEGVRGHIDEIQSYVTDVMGFTEDMKASYPNIPMFLMGHSMGGLIAAMMTIQRETPLFTGLLLSSPGLLLGSAAGPIKKILTKLLATVAPKLGVLSVDPAVISSIPEEVEAYVNDPLNIHTALKAGWAAAMMNAIEAYATRYGEITLPLYVMHGTGDELVPIGASELVYNTASSTDKVYEVFVDSFHEILHDIEQERARELISSWIIARLTEPVPNQ